MHTQKQMYVYHCFISPSKWKSVLTLTSKVQQHSCLWQVLDFRGNFWLDVDGCGWFLMFLRKVMDSCGWLWIFVDGCGWL